MGNRLVGGLALAAAGWWVGRAALRRLRRFELDGKSVLITGGSRGLGLLLARHLVQQGAHVTICARDVSELDRARHDIAAHAARGGGVAAMECDVTDREAVERVVREVEQRRGGVDVLINNAGIIQVGPRAEMTLEDYEQAMRVHYWGPLYATLAVLPAMRRRRRGRIVNIASIGGLISVPHLLPYSASKFALVGLSEGMRSELLRDGIYVTTVCPGTMRTGSHVNARFKGQHEQEFAWFSVGASAPLVSASAERVAERVVRACRDGQAQLVLPLSAKLAAVLHGLAPGATAEVLGVVDRLLPSSGGIGRRQAAGHGSRPSWLPRWLTRLGDKAARRNMELPLS